MLFNLSMMRHLPPQQGFAFSICRCINAQNRFLKLPLSWGGVLCASKEALFRDTAATLHLKTLVEAFTGQPIVSG
jgi:hypothetical protein